MSVLAEFIAQELNIDAANAKTAAGLCKADLVSETVFEFAELQALNRTPMTMQKWIEKLDEFLKISGRDILTDSGKISHDQALQKAHKEYEKFHIEELKQPTEVEKHFVEAEKELKKIESQINLKQK